MPESLFRACVPQHQFTIVTGWHQGMRSSKWHTQNIVLMFLERREIISLTPWLVFPFSLSPLPLPFPWKLCIIKPWSNENASHRKLTCVDLWWHQSNGGTSRNKFCTFASLTFLTWYVSYDSPLKRCLKDTFLILLCSNNSQVFASWKNLRWNLNKLKLDAS